MVYLYWAVIVLFLLFVLIGLKDGIKSFFLIWFENGFGFAFFTAILVILFILPSIVKDYAPNYYGLAVWTLVLYVACLLGYRLLKRGS